MSHKWNQGKISIIISIDVEKAFDKIQTPLMIKALKKLGIEGTLFNIIKVIYEKPIAKILPIGENLKPFPLKSEMRQGCPLSQFCLLSPLFFSIMLEFLVTAIRQEKEIKRYKQEKKNKLFLFAKDMILYLKDPKKFD
jgi:hypothetical protein